MPKSGKRISNVGAGVSNSGQFEMSKAEATRRVKEFTTELHNQYRNQYPRNTMDTILAEGYDNWQLSKLKQEVKRLDKDERNLYSQRKAAMADYVNMLRTGAPDGELNRLYNVIKAQIRNELAAWNQRRAAIDTIYMMGGSL